MNLSESNDNSAVNRNRSSRGHEITADDHSNVNFPPPLIHFVGVISGFAMNGIYPIQTPQWVMLWWLGVGLVGVALTLAVMGFREFSIAGNPVPPNRRIEGMMTGGPFRYSRNPLYLALALLHAGIALLFGTVWLLLSLIPVLVVVRYYVIAREEAYLTRRFGPAYRDYQKRVNRWF